MEVNLYGMDDYTVSDDGHIYSLNYNHTGEKKELVGYTDKDGYRVILVKNKKYPDGMKIKRYRAIADHFIPNPDNLPQVNHKDADRQNDSLYNLEWCTNAYNVQYANKYGSFDKYKRVVQQILNGEVINEYISVSEASRATGISRPSIVACLHGRQSKAGGYNWK